ncbi:MAG: hypothetical protein ABIS08_00355 [Pseudolysinimonas sp.]
MGIERRKLVVAIWALSALCIVLLVLLFVFIGRPAGFDRPRQVAQPTSDPGSSSTPTPTPSSTATDPVDATPNPSGGVGRGTSTTPVDQPGASYTISGTLAQQLQPGDQYPLDLILSNQTNAAMSAAVLHVTIAGVTAPNASASLPCSVSDFQVVQMAGSLSVALGAHETTSLSARGIPSSQWPQIGMINSSSLQNGCKGATLKLAFSGSGTA